jgi:hypothetical protein
MQPLIIRVTPGLDEQGYPTLAEALAAPYAKTERNEKLRCDRELVHGRAILDGTWTDASLTLFLSGKKQIEFFVNKRKIDWTIGDSDDLCAGITQSADNILLDFGPKVGIHEWNRASLLNARIGCRIKKLSVSDAWVFLYVEACPTLFLSRFMFSDTEKDLLVWDDHEE